MLLSICIPTMNRAAFLGETRDSILAQMRDDVAVVIVAGRLFFGIPWPGDWLALLVFLAAGVVCFASLGVALSHAINREGIVRSVLQGRGVPLYSPYTQANKMFFNPDVPKFPYDPAKATALLDEMGRESIVTGGDGRVRGEHGGRSLACEHLVHGHAGPGLIAQALEHEQFDYVVLFEYPNDVRFSFSHIYFDPPNFTGIQERVFGSEGALDLPKGLLYVRNAPRNAKPEKIAIPDEGEDMNLRSVSAFFDNARAKKRPLNDSDSGRIATLTGILGRTAIYEKRVVEWREVDL